MKISLHGLLATTAAYLFLPNIIFLLTWLQPAYGYTAALALVSLFFLLWNDSRKHPDPGIFIQLTRRQLISVLSFSALFSVFSGIGELMWQHDDFFKHNLIYSDLLRNPWPVEYTSPQYSHKFLCYYLAYYLPSVALGGAVGAGAVPIISLLWSFAGIALFFVWLFSLIKTSRWVYFIVFICVSGADFIWVAGHFAKFMAQWGGQYSVWDIFVYTLQYTRSEMRIPVLYQATPPFLTQMVSAPQHALPGYLLAAMGISTFINRQSIAWVAVATASAILWSPLVVLGITPLLVFILIRQYKNNTARQLLLAGVFGALLIVITGLYFMAHDPLDGHWVWNFKSPHIGPNFWIFNSIAFVVIKFWLWAGFLLYMDKRSPFLGEYKPLVWLSLVVLSVLGFYKLGFFNDSMMRSSLPFITILLIGLILYLQKHKRQPLKKMWPVYAVIALMILPKVWTVYNHIYASVFATRQQYEIKHVPPGYNITHLNTWMLEVKPELGAYFTDSSLVNQYLGDKESIFYRHLAKKHNP